MDDGSSVEAHIESLCMDNKPLLQNLCSKEESPKFKCSETKGGQSFPHTEQSSLIPNLENKTFNISGEYQSKMVGDSDIDGKPDKCTVFLFPTKKVDSKNLIAEKDLSAKSSSETHDGKHFSYEEELSRALKLETDTVCAEPNVNYFGVDGKQNIQNLFAADFSQSVASNETQGKKCFVTKAIPSSDLNLETSDDGDDDGNNPHKMVKISKFDLNPEEKSDIQKSAPVVKEELFSFNFLERQDTKYFLFKKEESVASKSDNINDIEQNIEHFSLDEKPDIKNIFVQKTPFKLEFGELHDTRRFVNEETRSSAPKCPNEIQSLGEYSDTLERVSSIDEESGIEYSFPDEETDIQNEVPNQEMPSECQDAKCTLTKEKLNSSPALENATFENRLNWNEDGEDCVKVIDKEQYIEILATSVKELLTNMESVENEMEIERQPFNMVGKSSEKPAASESNTLSNSNDINQESRNCTDLHEKCRSSLNSKKIHDNVVSPEVKGYRRHLRREIPIGNKDAFEGNAVQTRVASKGLQTEGSSDKQDQAVLTTNPCSSSGRLFRSVGVHSELKLFKCKKCDRRFTRRNSLNLHMTTHFGQEQNYFRCDMCNKRFACLSKLAKHLRMHAGVGRYQCDECDKSFTANFSLVIHKRTHSGEKPYTCDVCSENFKSKLDLKRHKTSHTSSTLYKCDTCGKSYTNVLTLTSHVMRHLGLAQYKCDECEKSFTSCTSLNVHKRIHLRFKPYRCAQCGRCFTQKGDLTVHKRLHSGERPYRCQVCGKHFTSNGNLKLHARRHLAERKYKCDECGKSFIRNSVLTVHKRTHSGEKPYRCDKCDQHFVSSSSLAAHKRKHDGLRPYKCDQCYKCFVTSSCLTIHKRRHAGLRPYSCDRCDKRYATSGELTKHKRKH